MGGGTAAMLAISGRTGYMAVDSDLSRPTQEWRAGGVPYSCMLQIPPKGHPRYPDPGMNAQRVDLDGAAFRAWKRVRTACAVDELYENPGPIQLSGPSASHV